jgi:hypothetical protein
MTRYTTATWPSCSKEEKKSVAGNGRVCVSRQNNKMRKEKSQFHFSAFSCLAQINRIKIVFCVYRQPTQMSSRKRSRSRSKERGNQAFFRPPPKLMQPFYSGRCGGGIFVDFYH